MPDWFLIFFVLILITILTPIFICAIAKIIKRNKTKNFTNNKKIKSFENSDTKYSKKCLITDYEKRFYMILKTNFEQKYAIQTQVNLLSIVNKNTNDKYRNELFRNIDFGIFDKNTLEPLVMIEINDKSHCEQERYKRDLKVREILQESKIPLITFYSNYPNKESYIVNKINEVLNK